MKPSRGASMRDQFKITFQRRGNLHIVDVDGDLTAATAEPLEQAYRQAVAEPGTATVLNLRCDYITSGGFAIIADLALRAHRDDRRLCLVGLNPHQTKVAGLLGIRSYAEIHPSLDDVTG